jgi:hypothetical protein
VTCWIGVNPRAIRWLVVELRRAQIEHGTLGRVEIFHSKVQMRLHGRGGVRPLRWLMARRPLEGQMEPRLFAFAHRIPIRVGVDYRPSGELAVEGREPGGIAAFEGEPAERTDT